MHTYINQMSGSESWPRKVELTHVYSKRDFHEFLNQAHASLRRAWFLKIDPVWIISMRACVRVCVRARGY